MSREHVRELCPRALRISEARLIDHSFRINGAGWATVVARAGSTVHGVLWRLEQSCLDTLDGFEGVSEALYLRKRMTIESPAGQVTAEIYVASDEKPGTPRPDYIASIVTAAIEAHAPAEYLRELESWRPGAGP